MNPTVRTVKILLVMQAVLFGVIFALCGGILAMAVGAVFAQAFITGAVAFAGGVPLVMAIQKAITA